MLKSNVLIVSVTSDIGSELAIRYNRSGCRVDGTYRTRPGYFNINEIGLESLTYCDINDDSSVSEFVRIYGCNEVEWDTLIFCAGNPLPIKPFFECDFEQWKQSIYTNCTGQLGLLHRLYPYRNKNNSNVVFFSSGGVNNPVDSFSAYTVSKIMLIKMCELLDSENKDMNFISIGPGFIHTKIHNTILDNSNDDIKNKTLQRINNGDDVSMGDIYNCIRWLCELGKKTSGRNFSVSHDVFDSGLVEELKKDSNMYKLRRYRNEG